MALWTLGQQVASTGYVVEPYRKYPPLLEVLLNFLKTEQNQGIRYKFNVPIQRTGSGDNEVGFTWYLRRRLPSSRPRAGGTR